MLHSPTYLKNIRAVVDTFGYWPSFHDAPVLRFQVQGDVIELDVETWEMLRETDARGYFKTAKHHQIGFRFSGVFAADLENFVPQNILDCLRFSSPGEFDRSGAFSVGLESAMGCDREGKFCARAGEVTFVRALKPDVGVG